MMRHDIFTTGERGAYSRAHTAAALRFYKSNGSPAVARLDSCESDASLAARRAEHSATWHAANDAELSRKCTQAGETAVRKLYRDMIRRRDAYAALEIRDAVHLARLERDAAAAVARLAELEPAPATRKRSTAVTAPADSRETRARELEALGRDEQAAVARLRRTSKLEPCDRHRDHWRQLAPADRFRHAVEGGTSTDCEGGMCTLTPGTDRYAASLVSGGPVTLAELNNYAGRTAPALEDSAPVADVVPIREDMPPAAGLATAPETVPASMPAMTRAARKASRRELAAAMRAAGLVPSGIPWQLARAGVDLADIPAILSGESAMPEGVNA